MENTIGNNGNKSLKLKAKSFSEKKILNHLGYLLSVCFILATFANSALGEIGVHYHRLRDNSISIALSKIEKESNGYWLYIDDIRTPAFVGVVYQPTAAQRHIDTYKKDLGSLYCALDDEPDGFSHGKSLDLLGVNAIRVYELPVENEADVAQTKEIFRRFYKNYRIKVLVCDWAGLYYPGIDFRNPRDIEFICGHLRKLVTTYCNEPWILGWQLGNENNYHLDSNKLTSKNNLGKEIKLDPLQYYKMMDNFAEVMKYEIGRYGLRQIVTLGQGELTNADANIIASMEHIDAIGINCYRDDPHDFEKVITAAKNLLQIPIYFAEIGKSACSPEGEEQQEEYLKQVLTIIFSHGAGRVYSGCVLGAFIHEATDELWKRYERGREQDAYYGIFGKTAEQGLGIFFRRQQDFHWNVLPTTDAPDDLIGAAWSCLKSPYAAKARDYGNAMAYANRAITLYTEKARVQQEKLKAASAPYHAGASSKDAWAITAVGTGYFIIGDCLVEQARDLTASEYRPGFKSLFKKFWYGQTLSDSSNVQDNIKQARNFFRELSELYPYGHMRQSDGSFQHFDKAIQSMFPELSLPYINDTLSNAVIFSLIGITLILLLSFFSRRKNTGPVKSVPVMSRKHKFLFLLVLFINMMCIFHFLAWWFHPVRFKFYTVQPYIFVLLSSIGASGILFYFYVWHLLWNMYEPVYDERLLLEDAKVGNEKLLLKDAKVAMVTTRVSSESIDSIREMLEKMSAVKFPHDTYLLDEENNQDAQFACGSCFSVVHFTRQGKAEYNSEKGKYQQRTKGGNLNAWLDQYGKEYDFVTFMDPDHMPKDNFLHRTLGYFADPDVAFVQAAQVFSNREDNWIARGAAEQSYFFYGPIQKGLFTEGACIVNGSHSTFRIRDLLSIRDEGYAVHDADDILTSIRLHALGKYGVYVSEVIAEGEVPVSWTEYAKQQRRWAYSMLNLLFHYYFCRRELRGMPFRCKISYLFLSSFYLQSVGFSFLLVIPFISAFLGNPPVNANIWNFLCRYLPLLTFHYMILLSLGQQYLISKGSRRGFWWRAGILWVGMWWDFISAFREAIFHRHVRDRQVTSKSKKAEQLPWLSFIPHYILIIFAIGTFVWLWVHSDQKTTVWGMLIFLGLIIVSQSYIVLRVLLTIARNKIAVGIQTQEGDAPPVPRK